MATAWIFTGGASFGAVQVGAAHALLSRGIRPDLMIGTSIGAMNAAYLASDPSPDGARGLRDLWLGLRRSEILPLRASTLLRGLLRLDNHLVDTGRLGRWLRRLLPYELIEDAATRLAITATDLSTAESVVLRRGDVVPALLASSAIPGIFPPVRVGNRWLVDGWFLANAPLAWAAAEGFDTVYVLRCGGVEPYRRTRPRRLRRPWRAAVEPDAPDLAVPGETGTPPDRHHVLPWRRAAINEKLVNTVVAHRIREEFLTWTPRIDVFLPPAPSVAGLSMYSLAEVPGLMDAARTAVARWIPGARPLTPAAVASPTGLVGVND